jgi:hypothetical protein
MNLTQEEPTPVQETPTPLEPLTVADAVWVGTAMLQRKHGMAVFSTEDIVNYVQDLGLTRGAYKSIWQHVNQHCVANRPPQPNRSCMLFATGGGNRRLFRTGDPRDPARAGAPHHPEWQKLPEGYRDLQQWYEENWDVPASTSVQDPLLALVGAGADIWCNQHADEYVTELRTNWGDAR